MVNAPSLEVFNARLDGALHNLIWWEGVPACSRICMVPSNLIYSMILLNIYTYEKICKTNFTMLLDPLLYKKSFSNMPVVWYVLSDFLCLGFRFAYLCLILCIFFSDVIGFQHTTALNNVPTCLPFQ